MSYIKGRINAFTKFAISADILGKMGPNVTNDHIMGMLNTEAANRPANQQNYVPGSIEKAFGPAGGTGVQKRPNFSLSAKELSTMSANQLYDKAGVGLPKSNVNNTQMLSGPILGGASPHAMPPQRIPMGKPGLMGALGSLFKRKVG